MAERPARRRKPSKSVEQLKAEIDSKEKTVKGITGPLPRPKSAKKVYALEKKRREAGQTSYGYSMHTMGGSSRGQSNPLSRLEEIEYFINYLLDEGFASDEKSAKIIANAMGEEWKESIIESRVSELGDRLKDLQQRSSTSDVKAQKTANLARKRFQDFSNAEEKFRKGVEDFAKATEKG